MLGLADVSDILFFFFRFGGGEKEGGVRAGGGGWFLLQMEGRGGIRGAGWAETPQGCHVGLGRFWEKEVGSEVLFSFCWGLSGPLNRLNAMLSLLHLDRYRTPSGIGSAIGRRYRAVSAHRVLDRRGPLGLGLGLGNLEGLLTRQCRSMMDYPHV